MQEVSGKRWVWGRPGGGTKQDKSHTGTELERVKLEKQNTLTKYV